MCMYMGVAARRFYGTICACICITVIVIWNLQTKGENQARITKYFANNSELKFKKLANKNLDMNSTHVRNKPLEFLNVDYKRNVYFTIKTTANNYQSKLSTLMLTWFQTVHKDDITIVTDRNNLITGRNKLITGESYVSAIRGAGFQLLVTDCPNSRAREALCCKSGTEFHLYYKAVKDNPRYQWFCHVDDDVYINIPELSHLLQQYDPHQPYYIGRWIRTKFPALNISTYRQELIKNLNIKLKYSSFRYATGSTYCLSYALMKETRKYFDGKKAFCHYSVSVMYGEDVTIGLVVNAILGYNLTNSNLFADQFDNFKKPIPVKHLKRFVTAGYWMDKTGHILPIKNRFQEDSTKFMTYHCLLYPSVSWCKKH